MFFAFNRHVFASAGEFGNNVTNFCTLVLLGVGETYVIATGGIDLSVGSTVSLSGVVGAIAMEHLAMHSELLVLSVGTVVCIGIGILVGVVNSALIHYARLVPFVATLVTWGAGAGMCLVLTGGALALTVPKIWIFSYPALIIIAITFVAGLFLHLSRFGRFTFAVGSNAFAARAVGINVKRQVTSVYVLSGALAGITGMFVYMRLGSGAPTAGTGQELIAIAAVVIGGARLTGGSARLSGTVIAAWMITIVSSGLIFMNVSPNYNQVAVALLIATAATAQALRKSARQSS